jgi:phospholipase C
MPSGLGRAAPLAALLALAASVGWSSAARPDPLVPLALQPHGNGLIAFASTRTGNNEVFAMNADGSGQVNLSNNSASDSQPAWSPDGTRVAFTSNRTGNSEVFVMRSSGTGQRNRTNNAASDSDPAWSSDGTTIAFTSNRTGNNEVFVMNADGSGQANLSNNSASDSQPAWSPDGTKIAFTSNRTGSNEVFVMNADGTGQADLSNDAAADSDPVFAPDQGTRIAFTTTRSGDAEVDLMDATDGSDVVDLSFNSAKDTAGDWQPLPAGPPNGSLIEHVVIIDMENHTFDNVLGKLCAANPGRCDGATQGELRDGTIIDLAQATDIVPVVLHTPVGQLRAVNGGLMNGFSTISGCRAVDGYACYSQFDQEQIPNLWSLAETYALSDRTFQQDAIATWGSHLELVAGGLHGFDGTGPGGQFGPGWGCDSLSDAPWHPTPWVPMMDQPSCIPALDGSGPYRPSRVPWVSTIMDRIDQAGLTWKIYGGVPFEPGLGYHLSICPYFAECLYGPQGVNFVQRDQFLVDAAAGTLPNLSIITPAEADSQHNNDSMLQGDNWLAQEVGAVMDGAQWGTSAIFITYDDCGCFYDHVPPPPGLGIRIPMVIVSPYARPGSTDSNIASFPSLLAFVEHDFGLAPLGPEDASAYDYSDSFDYSQRPLATTPLAQHPLPASSVEWLKHRPLDSNDST